MNEDAVNEIVEEVLSSLEPLETQSSAVIQFLKAKGLATDEDLAPFLEQAGNTASVRWRAVRVRVEALISNAMKAAEKETGDKSAEKPVAEHPATDKDGQKQEQEGKASSMEYPKSTKGPNHEEGKDSTDTSTDLRAGKHENSVLGQSASEQAEVSGRSGPELENSAKTDSAASAAGNDEKNSSPRTEAA